MPYIPEGDRANLETFDDRGDQIIYYDRVSNAGELNFVITMIINNYFKRHHNYQGIADVSSSLENAKLEFYRRKGIGYEQEAIKRNGDVE